MERTNSQERAIDYESPILNERANSLESANKIERATPS